MAMIVLLFLHNLLLFMFYLSGLVFKLFSVPKTFTSLLKYRINFVAILEGNSFLDAD